MHAIQSGRCYSWHFSWSKCATKTMSLVERPRWKPHWLSGSIISATCVKSRLSITLTKSLPPTDNNSEMPRLLAQSARSPLFLYMATMLASFHCWETRQALQILQMKACRWTWRSFPPYLNTWAGRWSTPQALLDLRPETADRTLVRVGVLSRQVMGGSGEGSLERNCLKGTFSLGEC